MDRSFARAAKAAATTTPPNEEPDMSEYDRPVALITGASRGIGQAIALELAGLGCGIVFSHFDFSATGEPDESAAAATLSQLAALGGACSALRADVSSAADRQQLLDFAARTLGRCDLLVNNAGVAPLRRVDLLEATEESFGRVMRINLQGPYFLTQAVAKWMIQQRRQHGDRAYRIVNISSMSAYTSSPARGEYCVSKAGVSMMTALYADRLAEYGIGVFEVRPGIIVTDMTAAVKDKYDRLIAEGLTPLRRWGQPEDVARAVRSVAEGRLDFSTGQVLNVDGGFHLRRL
jgi:NAD(P)-dependent dehydrogenase (short-subunit alcohol dehydrogenase family)